MFIHRGMLCRCTTLFQLNLVIDLGNCLYYIVLHFGWRSMHTQWSPAKDRSISYAPTFWEIFGGKHQVHTSSWKYNSQGLYFKVCPNPLWWEGTKTWFSKPHVWLPNLINILPSFYFQEHWNSTKCEPCMKMEHTPHKETLSKCIRPAYHEILEHLWTGLLPQSTTYTYDVSMHLKFLCN